jgi:hypothetical protein
MFSIHKNINNTQLCIYKNTTMDHTNNDLVDADTSMLDEVSEVDETSITEQIDDLENTVTTTEIDQITLSLLMNKNHYRKYVSQTNPEQHEAENQRISDNRKYRSRIIDLTSRLLDSPNTQITTDVDQIFVAYTKRLVQYFKMQDIEKLNRSHNGCYENDDEDEDVLFGKMDETPSVAQSSSSSFWGKDKVVKKGNLHVASYDMRMFSKR